jgi:hypothetical protein
LIAIIVYFELFVALFFFPGFFLAVILGIKKFRFLLSFALSYALLVLTLLPLEYYARPLAQWSAWIQWEWAILAVLAVARMLIYGDFKVAPFRGSNLIRGFWNFRLLIPVALIVAICGYMAYAGPYLEIPSDAWAHVARFQSQKLSIIDNGAFPSGVSFNAVFLNQGWLWYFVHAWLCHIAGLAIVDSLLVLTFVNVLIFLLAIYYFGLYLFAELRVGARAKTMMAAMAALFAAAAMGNNVFAYIRYYALAPTILNYVLFLAALAVIVSWLRSNRWFGHALWIVPVLLVVTNAIHAQEALFIFFMTLALSLLSAFGAVWRKFGHRVFPPEADPPVADNPAGSGDPAYKNGVGPAPTPGVTKKLLRSSGPNLFGATGRSVHRCSVREWKPMILSAVLLLVFFAGFAAIRHFRPGSWVAPHAILPHQAIPTEPVNFIFRNLMIPVPANPYLRLAVYQLFSFYQVVGCWGLFVYLLFGITIRRFVKLPYLMAGMAIVPFLTVFNPLTVDLIVRMNQSAALYRFIYLIPLPFVGAYLFVHFWGQALEWSRRMRAAPAGSVSPVWPRRSWLNFAGSILVLAGLIGLIFPIDAAGIYAPYSKFYTLRKIPAGNDYRLFDDLGKVVAQYENKIVLTDGWTSGYLMFYSPKNTYCHAKWLSSSNPGNEPPDPYTWSKLRHRGLVIVNRRNGDLSVTGRISKHWPEDVIPQVDRNYSLEARHYLESHPEAFRKIWARDRITVYAVR